VAIGVDVLVFKLVLSGVQVIGMLLIALAVVAHQSGWRFPWFGARKTVV